MKSVNKDLKIFIMRGVAKNNRYSNEIISILIFSNPNILRLNLLP